MAAGDPNPLPAAPKGFLLTASWLGFPPSPLKNPPPRLLDPNMPPPGDVGCWPNMLAPELGAWPNREPAPLEPNPGCCPKLNPEEHVVVVAPETLPNKEPP